MALRVAQVTPAGPHYDVYIEADSRTELGGDYAPQWRKLASAAVAGKIASPMIRSEEFCYTDADGNPLDAMSSMEAMKTAKVFRKVSFVGGGGRV